MGSQVILIRGPALRRKSARTVTGAQNINFIRNLLTPQMAWDELDLPALAEVAVQVYSIAARTQTDAAGLASPAA